MDLPDKKRFLPGRSDERQQMKILNESMLRAKPLPEGISEYCVAADVFVTPLAKEYLRDRGIALVKGSTVETQIKPRMMTQSMTRTPVPDYGKNTFIDAKTGRGYAKKPEHMTHLRGNLLIPKTDARIALRGQLDSLMALLISLQCDSEQLGCHLLTLDLGDLLECVRQILGAEVKEVPLDTTKILGLDTDMLRYQSHNVKKYFGIDHPIPDYTMGKTAASINLLRTKVRETELAAARAFMTPDGIEREDIIRQLNRLSSAVYIIFLRWLTGYYGEVH